MCEGRATLRTRTRNAPTDITQHNRGAVQAAVPRVALPAHPMKANDLPTKPAALAPGSAEAMDPSGVRLCLMASLKLTFRMAVSTCNRRHAD